MGTQWKDKLNTTRFWALLSKHYSLLSILIGSALFMFAFGPFGNYDSLQLEYEAASGVLKWGMPYMGTFGNMINQPPLGYYIDALFFRGFGLSYSNGVAVVTLFSLGCIFLVYKLGKTLYGKGTGLFASALFAVTPWQVVFARSFLIDVQSLFFSLLFLLVGIWAIRKDSLKLFMVSGVFFGVAFLTKFFAVFMLIPLALFFAYHRPKGLQRKFAGALFFLPALFFVFLWYQVIWDRGMLYVLHHDDFTNLNTSVSPSYFFVGNFLIGILGIFFLTATVLSLALTFSRRRLFSKILVFDLICLGTIVAIGGVNMFLAIGLNMKAPYFSPIKYDFQFLPFFSLLAASLAGKCFLLFNSAKLKGNLNKLLFSVALIGLVLLIASVFLNMYTVNLFSKWEYLLFKVEGNVGYSFNNYARITFFDARVWAQYVGFALIFSGLIWASKEKFGSLRQRAIH